MRRYFLLAAVVSVLAYESSAAGEVDQAWSTLVGGNWYDEGMGIAVDSLGHSFVTGWTRSEDFPVTAGAYNTAHNGVDDVFVFKLAATGDSIIWATYLGGIEEDEAEAIALDAGGNIYVVGSTTSPDFPTTPGAFGTTSAGGRDVFVFKLDPQGSALKYSTYLGGAEWECSYDIVVGPLGMAILAGHTPSYDFPTTPGAFDTVHGGENDGFVVKLNPLGTALVYSTFLGGSGDDTCPGLSLGRSGEVYVTGATESDDFPLTPGAFDTTHGLYADAFWARLSFRGDQLLYATLLGGDGRDHGQHIEVDPAGWIYVTGITTSEDFPTTPGAFSEARANGYDVFVAKFTPAGDALEYATYVGGGQIDKDKGMALSRAGEVCVVGYTRSVSFPTTVDALDSTFDGDEDGFAFKLNADGSDLIYATYLGGWHEDCAYDIAPGGDGYAHITGKSRSSDFPTSPGAFDSVHHGYGDVFVTKMRLGSVPIDDLRVSLEGGGKSTWGHFRLSWSRPQEDIWFDHYVIYRSPWAGAVGDPIASTWDTTYLDEFLAGDPFSQYFYTVKSVDGMGNLSKPSNMVGEWDVLLINESLK